MAGARGAGPAAGSRSIIVVLQITKSRGGVLLAQATSPSSETADRWLIGLRWIATAGMLATILIARSLVPALALTPLFVVLGAIAILNVGWTIVVSRRAPGSAPLVAAQVYVDVLALTAMLWWSGGTSNPFAAFLSFHIVLAGLLCGARTSFAVAGVTLVAIGVLWIAPPLSLEGAPLGADRVQRIGHLVSLIALSTFIGFFVYVYVQRLEQLRAEGARNEKLAMLGRLVGAMSHELNTPLATIVLASKDLVEVGRELGSAEASRLAQTVADEAERASDVIGLMRGHVRPDHDREPLELATFTTAFAHHELDRLGFAGERAIEAAGPVHAAAPRAGLGHILTNLLTNAVQATAGRPDARIEVTVIVRRSRVEVGVRDNGPGISPALLNRLGEPFQTTKGAEGGMGLGLYVSSVLAERMGGLLHVDSAHGGGTRVILSLPRRTVRTVEAPHAAQEVG